MYDELTRQDIQKMQEEIDYRVQTCLLYTSPSPRD